jgi:hypothetical protein
MKNKYPSAKIQAVQKGMKHKNCDECMGEYTLSITKCKMQFSCFFDIVIFKPLCDVQSVFQRFPLPEKDHLSFSLIYNNGKRSIDLVRFLHFDITIMLSSVLLVKHYLLELFFSLHIYNINRYARIRLR